MQTLSVIKIGGNVIDNEKALDQFLTRFSEIEGHKLLIHGGGKVATEIAARLGLRTQKVEGRRITDSDMLEVVTMVYGGLINKKIVAALHGKDCPAIGLTGTDANLILAHKRPVKEVDYGWVGDVDQVNGAFLANLLGQGLTPVIAPITHNGEGQLLNTNADTIATKIAAAMAPFFKTHLYVCFEKPGVLLNVEDEGSLIPELSFEKYGFLKSEGVIVEGMLPKLDTAFQAMENGVASVVIGLAEHILPGSRPANPKIKIAGTRLVHPQP